MRILKYLPPFLSLLLSLSSIVTLELAAGYWIKQYGTPYHKATQLLIMDGQLGWRHKRNDHRKFLENKVCTDEKGFRRSCTKKKPIQPVEDSILLLGPSSAFGWGVNFENTYGAMLEELINSRKGKQKMRVVNAAQIGYSSYQGARLLDQLLQNEKSIKAVIFSYGINDLDRHRFFIESSRRDQLELGNIKEGLKFTVKKWFSLLALPRVLPYILQKDNLPWYVPVTASISDIRVPIQDFELNLERIRQLCHSKGIPLFLIPTPTRYRFLGMKKSKENSLQAFHQGLQEEKSDRLSSANAFFSKIPRNDPLFNEAQYHLSFNHYRLNNVQKSEEHYRLALQSEEERISAQIRQLNSLLLEKSRRKDNGLFYVSLQEDLLLGRNPDYFKDKIHFTKIGNKVIAESLLKTILFSNAK